MHDERAFNSKYETLRCTETIMYTNLVIDISHYQGHVDFDSLLQEPISAGISKASYGLTGRDNTYPDRESAAKAAGLLWGAYHFGTGEGTGQDQAANFLAAINYNGGSDLNFKAFAPNAYAPQPGDIIKQQKR
jgi:lysozyme